MNVFQPEDGCCATTTTNNTVSLLTLPRKEIERSGNNNDSGVVRNNNVTTSTSTSTSTTTQSSPSFVLLQLPLNYTVDDFINRATGSNNPHITSHDNNNNHYPSNAYFVAASSPNTTEATNQQQQQQQQQQDDVACIVESKGCSFTVHRVETSNTLIVVPPPPPSVSPGLDYNTTGTTNNINDITGNKDIRIDINNNDDDDDDDHIDPTNRTISSKDRTKKLKLDSNTTTTISSNLQQQQQQQLQFRQILPAHIIQKQNGGGNDGSFFLELRPKQLRISNLRHALYTFDPYNDNSDTHIDNTTTTINSIGRSVYDLATSLRVSKYEIRQGLRYISAFAIPSESSSSGSSKDDRRYCLLAEHILNDCNAAIITGLFSMSDFTADYGGSSGIIGIDPTMFVDHILNEILKKDEQFTNIESILHHCLQLLHQDDQALKFILDVSKVAVCIVRGLFLKKTAPWNEIELFSMWQSELPGVGDLYQVSRSMLRGVAIATGNVDVDIRIDNNNHQNQPPMVSDQRQWHYVPVESMSSMDSQKCFDVLFSFKERYTMYELEPYLYRLIDSVPNNNNNNDKSSMTELLLLYTKLITEVGLDGDTRTFYQKK